VIDFPPGLGVILNRGRPGCQIRRLDRLDQCREGQTVRAYMQGLQMAVADGPASAGVGSTACRSHQRPIETRFPLQPDILSLVAMVPATIPIRCC